MLRLRLLMVMLVWCRAAAPVECGGSLRPELAVAAFPVVLQLSVFFAYIQNGSMAHSALLGLLLPV